MEPAWKEMDFNFQEPARGYLVQTHPSTSVNPISAVLKGRFLIGRAVNKESLFNLIKDTTGLTNYLCLPKEGSQRTCLPAGWISFYKNTYLFNNGWPLETGETVKIKDSSGNITYVVPHSRSYPLAGFEELTFPDHPQIKLVFIPPISTYPHRLHDNEIISMEQMKLWASAGLGWFQNKNFDQAIIALQKSLDNIKDMHLYHQLLLILSQAMKETKEERYVSQSEVFEKQVLEFLKVSLFEVNVVGKVIKYGSESLLTIVAFNLSREHIAKEVSIIWNCPDQKVTQRFDDIGDIKPRKLIRRTFPITPSSPSKLPFLVNITLSYLDQESIERSQRFTDFLKVMPYRPKILEEAVFIGDMESDEMPETVRNMIYIKDLPV